MKQSKTKQNRTKTPKTKQCSMVHNLQQYTSSPTPTKKTQKINVKK